MRFSNLAHPKRSGASDTKQDPTVLKARNCKVQLFSAGKVPEPSNQEKHTDQTKKDHSKER
jgi:hypothetical protein